MAHWLAYKQSARRLKNKDLITIAVIDFTLLLLGPLCLCFLFCFLAAAVVWYCLLTYIWNLTFIFAICALSTVIPTILQGASSLCVLVRINVDAAGFCKHSTRYLENTCFSFAIPKSLLDVWFNFWKSDCGCATWVQYLNTCLWFCWMSVEVSNKF